MFGFMKLETDPSCNPTAVEVHVPLPASWRHEQPYFQGSGYQALRCMSNFVTLLLRCCLVKGSREWWEALHDGVWKLEHQPVGMLELRLLLDVQLSTAYSNFMFLVFAWLATISSPVSTAAGFC